MKKMVIVLGIIFLFLLSIKIFVMPTPKESVNPCEKGDVWIYFQGPNELSKSFRSYRRLIDKSSWKKEVYRIYKDEYTEGFLDNKRNKIVFDSVALLADNTTFACLETFQEVRLLMATTFVGNEILYQEIRREGLFLRVIVIISTNSESGPDWTQPGLFVWLGEF